LSKNHRSSQIPNFDGLAI